MGNEGSYKVPLIPPSYTTAYILYLPNYRGCCYSIALETIPSGFLSYYLYGIVPTDAWLLGCLATEVVSQRPRPRIMSPCLSSMPTEAPYVFPNNRW